MNIYKKIKSKIISNEWEFGTKLPSEHELGTEFNVSRHTIRKALQKLSNQGYIYRKAGKGTFVKNIKSRYKLNVLKSFSEQMKNRNVEPSSKIIRKDKVKPTNKIKKKLTLLSNEKIYQIERIRKADDFPMAYEKVYIATKTCPNIIDYITENTSLYNLYENIYNLQIGYGDVFLEAQICNENISNKLNLKGNNAILKMEGIFYLINKKPLYYVESFYLGNRYIFSANIPREKNNCYYIK
jgi:GntR family transcriptional regulator